MSYDFDFSRFDKELDRIEKDYKAGIKRLAYQIAEEVKGRVKERTPVDTSRLRDGWHYKIRQIEGYGIEITIINNVEYAPYVEYGHRQGKNGYVKGAKMLTLTLEELDDKLEQKLEKMLKKIL